MNLAHAINYRNLHLEQIAQFLDRDLIWTHDTTEAHRDNDDTDEEVIERFYL